ncbi:hypothetical protein CN918_25660 [Priestia megaterium]|nr:hypothetical protein CN918_25660 [Priestia megaterium]
MKAKVLGAVIGVALCIWNERRIAKTPCIHFEEEFLHFLQTCKGHLHVKKNQWSFDLDNKGTYLTCTLMQNHNIIYSATYVLKDALIEEERYYRAYVSSSYWNQIEKELDKVVLPYFKHGREIYCLQEEERNKKDKPVIHALQKQLRVVKVRGW